MPDILEVLERINAEVRDIINAQDQRCEVQRRGDVIVRDRDPQTTELRAMWTGVYTRIREREMRQRKIQEPQDG